MADKPRRPHPAERETSSDLPVRLGRNIAAQRKALGLTQGQLAERLDVEVGTLSRFERGLHVPSLLTLERLASILRTTCGALLDETPQRPSPDALSMDAWLAGLRENDADFAKQLLKACCDHLAKR